MGGTARNIRRPQPTDIAPRHLAGADRSWRIGADGEHVIAGLLAELATPSRLDQLRRRGPRSRVLHSVPLGVRRAVRGLADALRVALDPRGRT